MRPTTLLPLWRKLSHGFLSPLKIHRSRTGLYPRTLGPMVSIITTRTPRPECICGGMTHFLWTATNPQKCKYAWQSLKYSWVHSPTLHFNNAIFFYILWCVKKARFPFQPVFIMLYFKTCQLASWRTWSYETSRGQDTLSPSSGRFLLSRHTMAIRSPLTHVWMWTCLC
jgi:hypothetical protein